MLAFCGVRPNEMRRLKWQDIRLATRTLVVDAMSAKTASRRTVPLCDAAMYWLNSCEPSEGLLWRKKADHWNRRLNRLHKRAGVTQQSNGLRHSYISYRLTLTGDVNRTAPALAAKVYGNKTKLTIGNDEATASGLNALGATHVNCAVDEVVVDNDAKLVTTPAYMLAHNISEANASITKMVKTVLAMK